MDFAAIIASILALFAPFFGGVDNAPNPAQLSSVVNDVDDWDDDWDD
ncbi:MAG: hypothetical protein GX898_10890 [Corynebacterium sp.]|nr:hypothetical protein [Corynebacterium sp.]